MVAYTIELLAEDYSYLSGPSFKRWSGISVPLDAFLNVSRGTNLTLAGDGGGTGGGLALGGIALYFDTSIPPPIIDIASATLTLPGAESVTVDFDDDTIIASSDDPGERQFTIPASPAGIALYNALSTNNNTERATLVLDDGVAGVAPSFSEPTGDGDMPARSEWSLPMSRCAGGLRGRLPRPTRWSADLPAGVSFDIDTRVLSFDEDAIESGSGMITIRATNSEGTADWTVDYEFFSAEVVADPVETAAGNPECIPFRIPGRPPFNARRYSDPRRLASLPARPR